MLGDLLTVNAYDNSERTFIVLGDLVSDREFVLPVSDHTRTSVG